jgi:hypothetical protein
MSLSPPRIKREVELLPEIRDLFSEYPFVAHRSPKAVRRALLVLRGVEAPESDVAAALESLRVEDEVLA